MTTSYADSVAPVTVLISATVNAFRPSARSISATYRPNGLVLLASTRIGPPGPSSGGGGGGGVTVKEDVKFAASALPAVSFTRGSVAPPLTSTVYDAEYASGCAGVSVAVRTAAL